MLPHLTYHISRIPVDPCRIVHLQPRPHDLVGIRDRSRKHLGESTQKQEVERAELSLLLGRAAAADHLQLFVRHELQRAVRNAEQGRDQTAIETPQAFRTENLPRPVGDGTVRAGMRRGCGQHPRFDHPDGVRPNRRHSSCHKTNMSKRKAFFFSPAYLGGGQSINPEKNFYLPHPTPGRSRSTKAGTLGREILGARV